MYTYKAKIKRVVDGDTFDLDIDVGFHITMNVRVRLKDIDTPEIRGSERPQGLIAMYYVQELFENAKDILVSTSRQGKYGRWLADIKLDGQDLRFSIINKFPELA